LRVRGANSEGVWSSDEARLMIAVQPPPWATWWAYALYGLTAAGIIFSYSRAQTRRIEREATYARRLELDVQARTRALEEQNERLQYANRLLEIASVTDSLTGVRNRRFLLTNVERDIAQIDRLYAQAADDEVGEQDSFLFLLCDLDGFKEINDRHGHSAGDLVLFQIRDLLNRACRSSDTLVRWGGDEFMIIGRSTSRETIQVLAERIRRSVANHLFDVGVPQPVRLTCSIGFASYPFVTSEPRAYSWEEVVELADRALFLAKRRGPDMWTGVFGTPRTVETPLEDLLALITERPELLIEEGSLSLQTSRMDSEVSLRTGT
jgi:diguanylate cyclase (GGDEF)-like protein